MSMTITSAVYGHGVSAGEDQSTVVDVTASVQALANAGTFAFIVSPANLNGGVDPDPGTRKQCGILYNNGEGTLAASGQDGETVYLIPVGS
jgi:hypothetical protein